MSLRVGLDVTPLATPLTGIGVFIDRLVAGLAVHDDVDAVGLAFTARGRDTLRETLPEGVALARPIPAVLARNAWRRSDLLDVSVLAGGLDVVHGTNFISAPARSATELITIHDLGPWTTPDLAIETSSDLPDLVARSLRRGAHVHAPSQFVGDQVAETLDLSPDRIHVIPHGVDAVPDAGGAAALTDELAEQIGGRPMIVAVGTIERRKSFDLLVESFADLADEHADLCLVLAGGPGNASLAVQAAIQRHGLTGKVIVTGYVSDADKAVLLRDAAVVVSSAVHEGFGFVPLEAMAAGTPAVATAGGSIPEVCGDAACLVPVGDGDALADGIDRVLTDDSYRSSLIEAGRLRAATFSWSRTVERFVELYRSIV